MKSINCNKLLLTVLFVVSFFLLSISYQQTDVTPEPQIAPNKRSFPVASIVGAVITIIIVMIGIGLSIYLAAPKVHSFLIKKFEEKKKTTTTNNNNNTGVNV